MSGFRKAKAEQAALKIGIYGREGSGKTVLALLLAEGLAALAGKRYAVQDTEHGTDFYVQPVPERVWHPDAFDFDADYSRSITDTLKNATSLDSGIHAVWVADSMTHLWESTKNAYTGPFKQDGSIPTHAWGRIKTPYANLMHWFRNSPIHGIIVGREGNEFAENDAGKMEGTGYKMKAEGETMYEPHLTIRMVKLKGTGKGTRKNAITIAALIEKDRTGILQGKLIEWPTFDTIARPVLHLLGNTQAHTLTNDEVAAQDAEALTDQHKAKSQLSTEQLHQLTARLVLATNLSAVEAIGKEITPALKRTMLPEHVDALRDAFLVARQRTKETNGKS